MTRGRVQLHHSLTQWRREPRDLGAEQVLEAALVLELVQTHTRARAHFEPGWVGCQLPRVVVLPPMAVMWKGQGQGVWAPCQSHQQREVLHPGALVQVAGHQSWQHWMPQHLPTPWQRTTGQSTSRHWLPLHQGVVPPGQTQHPQALPRLTPSRWCCPLPRVLAWARGLRPSRVPPLVPHPGSPGPPWAAPLPGARGWPPPWPSAAVAGT